MEIYNKVNELAKKNTPKFTDTEKILLLSLIEDVKEIVESPQTDSPTLEKKKATWELITEQYANSASNSGFPVRTEAQLKRCWINLKYRCRQSDSARKLHQLKTGGGPPIIIDSDEEDIHERVRSIVPTIDFTLKNRWDSTSEIERNMEDMQNIFKEEEMRNNEDFNKYKQENYKSSNENDYVRCKKIPKKIDSSLSKCSSKFNTVGSNVQRKPLQNILPKNDEGLDDKLYRLKECEDLNEELSNKKRKVPIGLEIEQDLRIQKLEESTKQQSELHTKKLRIIQKESEYWEEMKAAAKFEMKAMQAQLKYWRAKYSTIETDTISDIELINNLKQCIF